MRKENFSQKESLLDMRDECCRCPGQRYLGCYPAYAERLISGRRETCTNQGNDLFLLLKQGSPRRMCRRVYTRLMVVLSNLNLNLPHHVLSTHCNLQFVACFVAGSTAFLGYQVWLTSIRTLQLNGFDLDIHLVSEFSGM